jgi:hypothetical protein
MSEEMETIPLVAQIRAVIVDHIYDNLRGNPSRLLMKCRRLGHELATLEDINDVLKAMTAEGDLEVHSMHRSNTVFMMSKDFREAEQLRRHNLSVGFTDEAEEHYASQHEINEDEGIMSGYAVFGEEE